MSCHASYSPPALSFSDSLFSLFSFLLSILLISLFFIFSSTQSLHFFILSFIFFPTPAKQTFQEINFSIQTIPTNFSIQTISKISNPPLCFSPKSLTHKLFNSNRVGPMVRKARLGSESISNNESFQRENCWSVQLRSIQRVLLRWRWMIGLADIIVIVNSQAQPSSSSEQSH